MRQESTLNENVAVGWWEAAAYKEDEHVVRRFHEYFQSLGFEQIDSEHVHKYRLENNSGNEVIECLLAGNVFVSRRSCKLDGEDDFYDSVVYDGVLIESPDEIQFFFERGYRHALFFYMKDQGL